MTVGAERAVSACSSLPSTYTPLNSPLKAVAHWSSGKELAFGHESALPAPCFFIGFRAASRSDPTFGNKRIHFSLSPVCRYREEIFSQLLHLFFWKETSLNQFTISQNLPLTRRKNFVGTPQSSEVFVSTSAQGTEYFRGATQKLVCFPRPSATPVACQKCK